MFCAESTLLVCKNDSFPQPQIPIPDGKSVTAPVPKSQGTHYLLSLLNLSLECIMKLNHYLFHSFVCLDLICLLLQSQYYFPKMVF